MTNSLKELYDDLQVAQSGQHSGAASAATEDPFILKLSQLVLAHGVDVKASDIHIEPSTSGARIRYRIDGILHEMLAVPQATRDPLIRSIKVRANMVTDVVGRSRPQDARIDFTHGNRQLDLRLSSFPTLFGDVLAIRILDRTAPLLGMEQVGFPPDTQAEFERLIRRPNGMILVTGPAGSGKTTTLYAALNRLRSPNVKIVTLEDPVEYQVDGIDQGQINPSIGLTFASGLRAILRQDANIILVGEIRDKETAEIAIRAALTGHLVFSTLHTRHSFGATTRLIDMGIEPHLILGSVTGIVAQRLVRMVCQRCKAADPLGAKAFTRVWTQETGAEPSAGLTDRLSRGKGCEVCNQTGYRGRMGIFELLLLSEELKQMILDRATGQFYRRVVGSGKMRTMIRDGLEKASRGHTTVEEVLRVTGETEET